MSKTIGEMDEAKPLHASASHIANSTCPTLDELQRFAFEKLREERSVVCTAICDKLADEAGSSVTSSSVERDRIFDATMRAQLSLCRKLGQGLGPLEFLPIFNVIDCLPSQIMKECAKLFGQDSDGVQRWMLRHLRDHWTATRLCHLKPEKWQLRNRELQKYLFQQIKEDVANALKQDEDYCVKQKERALHSERFGVSCFKMMDERIKALRGQGPVRIALRSLSELDWPNSAKKTRRSRKKLLPVERCESSKLTSTEHPTMAMSTFCISIDVMDQAKFTCPRHLPEAKS